MKSVSIIGFGRFGQTLYRLLKDDFDVTIYSRNDVNDKNLPSTQDLKKAYQSEVIFYAVPISSFEEVISSHKKYFRDEHLLIDVLSVKMHPAEVFQKYLNNYKTQAILTHPMFGPDSSKEGFEGLPIIMDKFKVDNNTYNFWKDYFKNKKLSVIELSPKEHDLLAANSQGLTHFIGRLLEEIDIKESPIDSSGAEKLLQIKEQTSNDSMQLFTDLQHFNPYTKSMRLRLGEAYDKLYNKLLPNQINPNFLTVGIQGGKGSFNEEAVLHILKSKNISKYKIDYLYTSENVLKALHKGEIDRGQFAIHNSIGGIVMESIEAMAKYKFKIIEEFAIKISHALMIRKDARLDGITTIMAHPQVFAQCRTNLSKKYPELIQVSGEGELIDHALVAKYLSEEKIPKNIATMGSKILAEIYDLKIIEDNLQDLKENYTSFLMVER